MIAQPASPDNLNSDIQALTRPMRETARAGLRATLKLGERVFFVGHTGTGKTYLASKLIEDIAPPLLPVVMIDPKHMLHVNAGGPWEVLDDLPRRWEALTLHPKRPRHLRILIRPERPYPFDMRAHDTLNSIYTRIFNHGKCLVYLDEIQRLCYNNRASAPLSDLIQMGRQPKISVWGSTLRPSGIPKMFITETDHSFVFYLQDAADRDRMAEIIGPWGKEIPGPGKHDFWYRPPWDGITEPILVHQ